MVARGLLGLRVGGGADAEAERVPSRRLVHGPKLPRRSGISGGSRDPSLVTALPLGHSLPVQRIWSLQSQ